MNEANNSRKLCLPHSLCNNFRECPRCARIRQAKIANAVEHLQELTGRLDWSILYPNTGDPDAANKAKLAFLRKAMPEGAIWSVEKSKKNGNYHINIITPHGQVADVRNVTRWTNEIEGNVRHVGAYISKLGQMPSTKEYPGRLYGTAGTLWQALSQASEFPIVQGAAAQFAIDSQAMIDEAARQYYKKETKEKTWYTKQQEKQEMTKEQAREIAARWLPDIIANQREAAKKK